ncbi:MAG: hypothetical protein JSS14_22535 [Proteobacteria bacterium]|nr:hypothetical protein [Pseudomonadota bacterium]
MNSANESMTAAELVECTLRMVNQACAAARHELNELEMTAWIAVIETFGPDPTTRFLMDWVSTNSRKAPTVADLRKALDPTFVEEESALERLYKLVVRIGPYTAPTAETAGPTLCRVIENMGGWAKINEIMPERGEDRFAWKAFAERFSAAFGTARAQEFQASLLPADRRPALAAPVGLHEMAAAARGLAQPALELLTNEAGAAPGPRP